MNTKLKNGQMTSLQNFTLAENYLLHGQPACETMKFYENGEEKCEQKKKRSDECDETYINFFEFNFPLFPLYNINNIMIQRLNLLFVHLFDLNLLSTKD